jgi:GH15 family glucan-1,4-alpha-glucosidase
MLSTIRAIQRDLTVDDLVLRYLSDDGLEGQEGSFVICSFWLVSCLAKAGMLNDAEALFAESSTTPTTSVSSLRRSRHRPGIYSAIFRRLSVMWA